MSDFNNEILREDEKTLEEYARALIEEICNCLMKGDSPASLHQIITEG